MIAAYGFISIDINECDEENGSCAHICNNRIGSYQCFCEDGYELDSDQHSCNGTNSKLLYNYVGVCLR